MNSCYNDKFCHEKWGGSGHPSRPGPLLTALCLIKWGRAIEAWSCWNGAGAVEAWSCWSTKTEI